MKTVAKKRGGFTLVELVVVIMILGILAAVAAPRLLNTSANATDNGIRQTLGVVLNAIELYAAEHAGSLPPCTTTGDDFKTALQPYLRGEFPTCPVGSQDNEVAPITGVSAGAATPTEGWAFNTDNGEFIVNFSGATESDNTINYDDL